MRALRYLVLGVLILQGGICFAQKKIPIEVAHAGDDSVGRSIADELRASIRTSQDAFTTPPSINASEYVHGLMLTLELGSPRIRLQLLVSEAPRAGLETPIAVNIIYESADMPLGSAYIRTFVGTCAVDDTASCSASVLNATNRSLEWLRQNWPSLWRTL